MTKTIKTLLEEIVQIQEENGVIWTLGSAEGFGEQKFACIIHPRGSNDFRNQRFWSAGDDLAEVLQGAIDKYRERYD